MVSFTSFASSIYYAKVVKIDDHNVIYVVRDGLLRAVSLGYVSSPVKGEVLFAEAHAYLVGAILEKWVRITELSYGRHALVKPVLVRTKEFALINSEMVEKGLALPDFKTKPPSVLVKKGKLAQKNKVGLWPHLKQFVQDRNKQNSIGLMRFMENYRLGLEKVKSKGIEPYLGDVKTKIAYKLKCFNLIKKPIMFATQYVAQHKGYVLNKDSCPSSSK